MAVTVVSYENKEERDARTDKHEIIGTANGYGDLERLRMEAIKDDRFAAYKRDNGSFFENGHQADKHFGVVQVGSLFETSYLQKHPHEDIEDNSNHNNF